MKKLILSTLLIAISIASFSQIDSKKKIIDYPHYVQIIDTAAKDTSYAPYDIYKPFRISKIIDGSNEGGDGIGIYSNREDNANSDEIADYKMSYKEFNDFTSNADLIDYLEAIAVGDPLFTGYKKFYKYDSNNNVDTIYFYVPETGDTSFYWWGSWTGTLIDSADYNQY